MELGVWESNLVSCKRRASEGPLDSSADVYSGVQRKMALPVTPAGVQL